MTAVLALLGGALAVFCLNNVAGNQAPFAKLNERIVSELADISSQPADQRLQSLSNLVGEQERALTGKPAEPFAWARLAYLRLATQNDKAAAFAALRLSDLISPEEPRQLPERALMWRQMRSVEDKDQISYGDTLWQRAFDLQAEATWDIAKRNNIIAEVGEAIKQRDPLLYEEWKERAK